MAAPSSIVAELLSRGVSETPSFEIKLAWVNLIFQLFPRPGSRISPNCWWNVPQHRDVVGLCKVPQAVTRARPWASMIPETPSLVRLGLKVSLYRCTISLRAVETSSALSRIEMNCWFPVDVAELSCKLILALASTQKCWGPNSSAESRFEKKNWKWKRVVSLLHQRLIHLKWLSGLLPKTHKAEWGKQQD